ncbi:solute carrier family 49 member A3-like isoform X2 [Ruditapes philippinarum]|uniref:solute carrier family 49 member A3-like isoform X2 n=1 Tax=Ruditapes philippinarum TaxID=129788 RepID=UPI00295AB70D|nr:solute carrier family 49 member A3-like isoform X2 [Ruditapes philippinarum]
MEFVGKLLYIPKKYSSKMMWLTFAPVADTFIAYYGISSSQLNMLSMTFLIATIPLGFVATWVLDTQGLRTSLLIATWLNSAGALLRNISSFDTVPKKFSYVILLCGQILAACAQPFVMFAPTKMASIWFPCHRRATANMIGSMMKPLGNMVAFIFIPFMVDDTSDIPAVLWVTSALAFFITIVATFGIRDSRPPTPPSASAGTISTPFLPGLKHILFNKNYIVLNLVFGGGQALFTAVTAFMEQILCPRGYTDEFSGLCASLMLGVGMIMAVPVSLYVDKTKHFDEVFKVLYGLSALFAIVFTQVSRLRDQHVWVAIMTALFGGCGISLYAIGFELAVEVTYPVAAATGSGLCLVGGQIQGIIYMFIMQYLTRPLPAEEMQLETGCYVPEDINADTKVLEPRDWTYSNLYILNCISCGTFVLLVFFFRPKYKRLEAERTAVKHINKNTDITITCSTHL